MAAIHRRCVVLGSEVAKALKGTGPSSPAATNMANLAASKLVVLESAILTHGMPYPENFHMAKRVQEIIRENVNVHCVVSPWWNHVLLTVPCRVLYRPRLGCSPVRFMSAWAIRTCAFFASLVSENS